MKLTAQLKSELIAYLPQVMEGEVRHNYSGRCLGFVYNSEREAILDMLAVATYKNLDIDRKYFGELFQNYQIDSMGRGVILYFPTLKT